MTAVTEPDPCHSLHVATVPADWWDYGDESVAWRLSRELRQSEIVLEFVVDGEPAVKARPRMARRGGSVHVYTPTATKTAEEVMGWRARAALPKGWQVDGDTCFGVMAVFFSSTWQRRDADNMLKLVCDALTGIVWVDDSQVSEVSAKVAARGDPDPRTHVRVYRTLAETPAREPCLACGKAVRQFPSLKAKFCSPTCRLENSLVTNTCRTCGKETRVPPRDVRMYCDQTCRYADPNRRIGDAGRPRTTHCPQGHERTPLNTYSYTKANGTVSRTCRICHHEAAKERYRRKLS